MTGLNSELKGGVLNEAEPPALLGRCGDATRRFSVQRISCETCSPWEGQETPLSPPLQEIHV